MPTGRGPSFPWGTSGAISTKKLTVTMEPLRYVKTVKYEYNYFFIAA